MGLVDRLVLFALALGRITDPGPLIRAPAPRAWYRAAEPAWIRLPAVPVPVPEAAVPVPGAAVAVPGAAAEPAAPFDRLLRTGAPIGRPVAAAQRPRGPGAPGAPCADARCAHHSTLVRLRRDLHDQVGSSLVGMAMQLEVVAQLLAADPEEATEVLDDVRSEARALVAQVRKFASTRDEAPPQQPCGGSIATAVSTMIQRMNRAVGDRLRIDLRLDREVDQAPREAASAAYWILREAVTNVLKHSRAATCSVSMTLEDGGIRVVVEDDGVGIPMPRRGGSGLGNIAARAREHGGWCRFEPRQPSGLTVLAVLPLRHLTPERRA
ncbi:histidine kinase [Amycolatopsis sp. NBC_00345]|uniref:sensor histidine kinase n=1 Tax=Amycolatopsis sp. NBC_00345 TaxID=2975955 RepID=UPI002E25DB11